MNICIAGWYYHKPLLAVLNGNAFIVGHCCHDRANVVIPNVGLEFGCYDWFLKNYWKSGQTLFMHDDNDITSGALAAIEKLEYDQAFLFSSEKEMLDNGGAHGRAILCSNKFLRQLKADGGFWYDEGNNGSVPVTTDLPDYHNNGILMFRHYLDTLSDEYNVNVVCVVEGLTTGYRGELHGAT